MKASSLLCVLVFAVFLILKLAETGVVAGWSWWWVCAPLWIPAGIIVVIGLIAASISMRK
jgi:hypothetical protein